MLQAGFVIGFSNKGSYLSEASTLLTNCISWAISSFVEMFDIDKFKVKLLMVYNSDYSNINVIINCFYKISAYRNFLLGEFSSIKWIPIKAVINAVILCS